MATFTVKGDIDDHEQFLQIFENLARDAENVEDRIKRLHEMNFEVSFATDPAALDKDEPDVLDVTVEVPK